MEIIKIIGNTNSDIPWQEHDGDLAAWRYSENPIIARNEIQSGSRTFNSGIVKTSDGYVGVFRVDYADSLPRLHLGKSGDGIKWTLESQPIKWIDSHGEESLSMYSYDPRLIELENKYYIVWCTDNHGPSIGLGVTNNFKTFTRLDDPFFPYNRNAVLFPRKINGYYQMLSRPSDNGHTAFGEIFLSQSPDLCFWGKHKHVMASGASGWWESLKIGAGPAPIETDKGWLLFYHGVTRTCNGYVYSIGAALLDINNPSKVLLRGDKPLITPQENYETVGFVPNVCFPTAALTDAATGRICVYYGAADTGIGMMFTTADKIYKWLIENNIK